MTKPKGRSQLQKSQAMVNLARINEAKQDPEIVRQAELETARERAASYEKHFQNASRQVSHTKAAKEHLEEHLDAIQADAVAQLSEAAATNKSLSSTIESLHDTIDSQSDSISDAQQRLKGSHSRISDLTKQRLLEMTPQMKRNQLELFRSRISRVLLPMMPVLWPMTLSNLVFQPAMLTVLFILSLNQWASLLKATSVTELSVVLFLRVVDEVHHAESLTVSGDGTTLKHIPVESRMMHLLTPTYDPNNSAPVRPTRFLGIHSSTNHKSQTQLDVWKTLVQDYYTIYNACHFGTKSAADADEFPTKVTGMMTDHAPDQYSLADGMEKWNLLSDEEKGERDAAAHEQIIVSLGQAQYEALSDSERHAVDLFIHAGCCMHKETNSCKGGNSSMTAWWADVGIQGPIKLMNRDNTAAAAGGSSAACKWALNVSGAGGVKATNLAATELILHHSLYIEFLELVHDKKESGSFTNMESNLYKALQDIPTLTELAVLTLYSISVCLPYLKRVWGDTSASALDLGPLHDDVKSHCAAIIDNPGLLLDDDASHISGCLFGDAWEQPEVFYAVHALMPQLPHIKDALIAFFKGTLATWECFTPEFAADGIVTTATVAERAKAWMPTTNDANEGALGDFRVAKCKWPNLTLAQYNSHKMYARNNTGKYILQSFDTPEKYAFLHKSAREWNQRESEGKHLEKQGMADQEL
ncbi:hypothetical protein PILCRDRAFT_92576 [Piloderma croceum F 1598]|uniref:Uncharacterized protein n=1 Tax=Piloderma croceum (strain F 1598) TaxID=765440 RepID=A0A0C3EP73_PILCF|nr:hypothetical protein PILCRDRAFT_92576 [Piloderma croceum F 1598]